MDAGAGCRNPRSGRYRFMPGNEDLPADWNQQISTQQPDRHRAGQDSDDEWDSPSNVHRKRQFEEFKELQEFK